MDAARPEQRGLAGRLAVFVVGGLARNNILYVLSAFLMLLGCFLISVPHLFEYHRLSGLLTLLGVINIYEAMVIAALGYVARRSPSSRECSMLTLLEVLFLLDATLTINATVAVSAFLPQQYQWGLVASAASLALAFVKAFAIEAGTGRPVFAGVRAFMAAALVLLYTFQWVLALYPAESGPAREACAYVVWMAAALLPMVLFISSIEPWSIFDGRKRESEAWWLSGGFRRAVALLAIAFVLIQILAQSWVHGASYSSAFAAPVAVALLAALPLVVAFADRTALNVIRFGGIAAVLVLSALVSRDTSWVVHVAGAKFAISPIPVNMLFAAACFAVLWRRERLEAHLLAACALATLGLVLRTDAAVLHFARWWPLVVLVVWTAGRREPALRFVLVAVVLLLGLQSVQPGESQSLAYFALAACAIGAEALARRAAPLALVAYFAAADLVLGALPVPSGATQWGCASIAGAFAAFGAAFLITRRALAAGGKGGGQP